MSNVTIYYPPISELINKAFIPEDITFLDDKIFKSIRYRDFKVNSSPYGDIKTYDLTIVLKDIRTALFATDLELVFFPNETEDIIFPFYIQIRWGIKRYIREFELGSFSFSLQEYFDLLLKMIRVSEEDFVKGIITIFIDSPYPYVQFVKSISETVRRYKAGDINILDESGQIKDNADDIISKLDQLALELEEPSILVDPFDDPLTYLLGSINKIGYNLNIYELIYGSLIRGYQSFDQKLNRLIWLFKYWMGNVSKEDLINLLIPQFSLSISDFKLALAFPQSWLQPMDQILDKAMLSCNIKSLSYSTQAGLQFNELTEFHLSRSSLLNTGIIIEATGGTLDLNQTNLIPQARADDRTEFLGAYLDSFTIEFPPTFPISSGTLAGEGILIGAPDGLSGRIKIENAPLIVDLTVIQLEFSKLDIVFKHNTVDSSDVAGLLRIPGLDKSSGGTDIAFTAEFDENGFKNTTATLPPHKDFTLFGIDITLQTLIIGFDQSGLNQLDLEAIVALPIQDEDGNPVVVEVDIKYDAAVFGISLRHSGSLSLFGLQLYIATVNGSFGQYGLIMLDIAGSFEIPGINKAGTSDSAPLDFEINYHKNTDNYRLLLASSQPNLDLFGLSLELYGLSGIFSDKKLQHFLLSGAFEVPGLVKEGQPGQNAKIELEISVTAKSSPYSLTYSLAGKIDDQLRLFGMLLKLNPFSGSFSPAGLQQLVLGGTITIPGVEDKTSNQEIEVAFDLIIDQSSYQFSGSTPGPFSLFGTDAELSDLALSGEGTRQTPISELVIEGKLFIPGIQYADGSDDKLGLKLLISDTQKSFTAVNVPPLKLGDYTINNFSFSGTLDDGGDHEVMLGGNLDLTALGIDDPVTFLITIKPGSLVVSITGTPEAKITFNAGTLVQVNDQFEELTDEPANIVLDIGAGGLTFDSGTGLQISSATATFNERTNAPLPRAFAAKIPKAGLFLDFNKAIGDLSSTSNISEVIQYDPTRDVEFKGVYAASANLWLPNLRKKKDETPEETGPDHHIEVEGKNLVIGEPGGITGDLTLKPGGRHQTKLIAGAELEVLTLSITLKQNTITATTGSITAILHLPDGDKIGLSFTIDDPEPGRDYYLYKAGIQSSVPVKILDRDVTITDINFAFSERGIEALSLGGIISLNGKDLTVAVAVEKGGFFIVGGSTPSLELDILGLLRLELAKLGFGQWDGKWFFLLEALGELTFDLPVIGDVLPEKIELHPLLLGEHKAAELDEDQREFFFGDPNDFPKNSEFTISWPDGFQLGSDTASKVFVINKKILGILQFNTLEVAVGLEGTERLKIGLGFDVGLDIGPVHGAVKGLGVSFDISPDNNHGNVGPLRIEPKLIKPSGIMLSVEAVAFKGSGAIYFEDPVYLGFIELSFAEKFTFTALAIVRTKMPDGTPKLSFIVLINVTDLLIQIGMGFVITGFGGLFGFRRHANTEYIRELAHYGGLGDLMFPSLDPNDLDPVLNNIASAFPAMDRHFIVGMFVQLGFGGIRPILRVDTGLIIDIDLDGLPVIVLPGVLQTLLPKEDSDLVRIEARFVAILDLPRKTITFDAGINGSRLMKFTLTGGMIFVLTWGAEASFLVSAGGFHPATDPPDNLPIIPERIQLTLLDEGENQVFMNMYLAVTSNYAATGALVMARFRAMGYDLLGWMGFDVLFQFKPFSFSFSASTGFGVFKDGEEKAGIMVAFELSGPNIWKIKGTGTATVLGVEINLNFERQWGDIAIEIPSLVQVFPQLKEAVLNDDNWRAELADDRFDLISYRSLGDQEGVGLIMHPASVPSLHQQVVPLRKSIDKFGSGIPVDGAFFRISNIKVLAALGTVDPGAEETTDLFAPAQFFELSDTEKLQAPSFKKYRSGFRLSGLNSIKMGLPVRKNLIYESVIIRGGNLVDDNALMQDPAAWQVELSAGNAAGQSGLAANNRPERGKDKAVNLLEERFLIVNNHNLEVYQGSQPDQLAGVEEMLSNILLEKPELEDQLEIISAYELDLEISVIPG